MTGVIGLNHKTAPLALRERLTFDEDQILCFAGTAKEVPGFNELVVISTCNRTEVYFVIQKDCSANGGQKILSILLECKEIEEDVSDCFYSFTGIEAVLHLFRVTAGINSMVLGENQILGQVKQAYRISAEHQLTGPVLNKLFHRAFEVGKRVRSDTAINQGASSISYAAVELCEKIYEDICAHNVLLIGAGETGELALKGLKDRGCSQVTVINRTLSRAETIAEKYGAQAESWDRLEALLCRCDIIISSTSSQSEIIGSNIMADVMKKRKSRTIFLIDLGVPRDINSSIKDFENAFLYNIDDLNKVVAHNYEKRKKEIQKAEKIIVQAADDFDTWFNSLKLGPTIEQLTRTFRKVNDTELEKMKNRLPLNEYKRVEEYGRYLQGKYLGALIKNLKDLSENGNRLEYLDLVGELFQLRKDESA